MKKQENKSESDAINSINSKKEDNSKEEHEKESVRIADNYKLDLISSVVEDFNEVEEIKKPEPKKSIDLLIQHDPGEKIEKKAQQFLEKQKDYSKYELVRNDYPLFLQLPNACGLSSTLMLIDPIQNEQIGKILNQVWDHVKKTNVIEQSRREFQWAFALNYLLLKSAIPNALFEYIKSLNAEELDHYYIGLESTLRFYQQEHLKAKNDFIVNAFEDFFARGLITQFVLAQHIDLFKHNPEIRILMAIFGYEFVRQPSPDGTGALFFTAEELKNLDLSSAKKKINVLRSEFVKGARIMVGFSFHWVALTNVFTSNGNTHISINDPSGEKYDLPLTNLSDRDRFYFYRKMKLAPKRLWNQILKIIEDDGPREIELGEKFRILAENRVKIDTGQNERGDIQLKIQVKPEGELSPVIESTKPIPLKIHEDAVQSIKLSKKQAKDNSIAKDKKDSKPIEEETSSKDAFKKKMRKIIGDQFQEYEDT
ncbi:MAG: hypothetical protein EU530_08975 [Promethearchaeota archaeon]|nr:MAG: hypothetical protein EU530_08975 [Candidatus Lokiarchaeota archaeon]